MTAAVPPAALATMHRALADRKWLAPAGFLASSGVLHAADPRVPACPFALAQHELLGFAGRCLRQRPELDRIRVVGLLRGGLRARVRLPNAAAMAALVSRCCL